MSGSSSKVSETGGPTGDAPPHLVHCCRCGLLQEEQLAKLEEQPREAIAVVLAWGVRFCRECWEDPVLPAAEHYAKRYNLTPPQALEQLWQLCRRPGNLNCGATKPPAPVDVVRGGRPPKKGARRG